MQHRGQKMSTKHCLEK